MPDVSVECLEAIELLLKKDPKDRITIFDFLHHPWLQAHQKWRNRKIWNDCYSSDSKEFQSEEEEAKEDEIEGNQKEMTLEELESKTDIAPKASDKFI